MTTPDSALDRKAIGPSSRTEAARKTYRLDGADWAGVVELLSEVPVAHVGFAADGQPFVIPVAAAIDGQDVLLHGSTGSRWLRLLGTGIQMSAAVTSLDALIVARSAFESSMRYRSVVLFGSCTVIEGDAKLAALDVLTDALIPGRVAEVRRPLAKELAATLVLRLTVEDYTLKVSNGWPDDADDDIATDVWAGIVPLAKGYLAPMAASDLRDGLDLPRSVRGLRQRP